MPHDIRVAGFSLQDSPPVIVAAIPGHWLLKHSTPSWRAADTEKGFQRIVRDERARQIAVNVLDQRRSFPNSIVLATNARSIAWSDGQFTLPASLKLLVVDGQHRLWAQRFSEYEAKYCCVLHLSLSEVQMARLFLEINDNQKRVPSSLRWDLVRLVRPDDDPLGIRAAELVFELATDRASALFQRIDLTGEQGELKLKQGSIAPEIKTLVSSKRGGFRDLGFEGQFESLKRFLAAVESIDSDGWRSGESPLVKARVLRAVLRLLPDIAHELDLAANEVPAVAYMDFLSRIDLGSLAPDRIQAIQGAAGIKQIYQVIRQQAALS